MNHTEIANQLNAAKEKIILVYAFNSTGKTRLSVAYKDVTKAENAGNHAGVYYNAFSEDLFVWDNDTKNGEQNIRLVVNPSNLNQFYGSFSEIQIREKLTPYKPKYDFYFNSNENPEIAIDSITFFIEGKQDVPIKISRGEERIFVWCFFLALFEVGGWADKQNAHFFIDDPVSSLDDNNIYVTASTMYDLIDAHHRNRKIIITTHHIGLYSILYNWLAKGDESERYEKITKYFILNRSGDEMSLDSPKKSIFLYHLHLLQTLDSANKEQLFTYHFALLRQVLENVASFLGTGQFAYVLNQIGIVNADEVASIVNSLSHKKVYYYETGRMNPDNEVIFKNVFERLMDKYKFKL